MATMWYYQLGGEERGPVTFHDLARMIVDLQLPDDLRVRNANNGSWITASSVIGLNRAAKQYSSTTIEPPISLPEVAVPHGDLGASSSTLLSVDDPNEDPVDGILDPEISWRRLLARYGIGIAGAFAVGLSWWSMQSPRYPESRLAHLPAASRPHVWHIRAPIPKTPSIPGLEVMEPKELIPMGSLVYAASPTLSRDLQVLVFAGIELQHDSNLYVSHWNADERQFETAHAISLCNSSADELSPSCSPDGLGILFMRQGMPTMLQWAVRQTTDADFDKPVAIDISLLLADGQQLEGPQFVDDNVVALVGWDHSFERPRRFLKLCRWDPLRRNLSDPVSPQVADLRAAYYVPAFRNRMYFGFEQGLFLVHRSGDEPFSSGEQIADGQITGPIDPRIWITPAEDVIFYSSPDTAGNTDNIVRLWMIRY